MNASGPSYQYIAFGISVDSAVSLSGFPTRSSDDTGESKTETLDIRRSSLRERIDDELDGVEVYNDPSQGLCIHRLAEEFFLQYRNVGRLRVSRDEIVFSPSANADASDIEWLVANLGLRLALIQRGTVVFHASAAVVEGSLVAFAGPSGRGKSTIAAACYAAGHTHHSDDVVPVAVTGPGREASVAPGPARMRVNEDVIRSLRLSQAGRQPDGTKAVIDTGDCHSTAAKELEVLYLLADDDSVAVDHLTTQNAVFELLSNSYALYAKSDAGSTNAHFDACGTIAGSVDVRRLSRPRSLQQLDRSVAAIERDVSK